MGIDDRGPSRECILVSTNNVACSGGLEASNAICQGLRLTKKVRNSERRIRAVDEEGSRDVVRAATDQVQRIGIRPPIHRGQIIIDLCGGAGKRRIWKQISGPRISGGCQKIECTADRVVCPTRRICRICCEAKETAKYLSIARPRAIPVRVAAVDQ